MAPETFVLTGAGCRAMVLRITEGQGVDGDRFSGRMADQATRRIGFAVQRIPMAGFTSTKVIGGLLSMGDEEGGHMHLPGQRCLVVGLGTGEHKTGQYRKKQKP
jgi:hypothetical protein